MTPLCRTYLSSRFWHLSRQKLRERAKQSVPRISISRALCLQPSKSLSEGRSIIVCHWQRENSPGSPKVTARSSYAKELLGFSARVCLFEVNNAALKRAGRNHGPSAGDSHVRTQMVWDWCKKHSKCFFHTTDLSFAEFWPVNTFSFPYDFFTTAFISPVVFKLDSP